jgi:hypothetical protein
MLDDLRNSSFMDEEEPQEEKEERARQKSYRGGKGPFLGMTAPQRFVLVLMLFFMVCLLGSFALILTEKVVLPFI